MIGAQWFRIFASAGFAMFLGGCAQDVSPTVGVRDAWERFPFDGERTWSYVPDGAEEYTLEAYCDGVPVRSGGVNVYTMSFVARCSIGASCAQAPAPYSILWSSDHSGVFVHGYVDEGLVVDFDVPLLLASDLMLLGESLATNINGVLWTSTLVDVGTCPTDLAFLFSDDCGTWSVEREGGGGEPVTGQWWNAEVLGFVAFQHTADFAPWRLSEFSCTPEEECNGVW